MTSIGHPAFLVSVALHLLSVLLFLSGRRCRAILTLFLGAIAMRYYFVGLDPFIHDWDERFHALVAKNLSRHWLMPTLIDSPILPYERTNWWQTHVWLHKQPLFLWQMACSIKLFGVNEFAVRLPSLIMMSLMVFIVYLMGKSLFDRITGYIAAFIFSCYEPLLEMNSGMRGMEHNDIAFLFYVSLSICAWIYFEQRGRRSYLVLMGFFAGCAVLNKWLTGLLVFSGFAFYHFFLIKDLFTLDTIKKMGLALLACLCTFLPWQLYILKAYPVEARYEYMYNSLHLYQVVEGHAHETWFYINILPEYFKGLQWLIFAGILFVAFTFRRHRLALAVSVMVILIYVFFTIAQTKLWSYVMVVMPLCLILMARVISLPLLLVWWSDRMRYILGVACFAFLFITFIEVPRIKVEHMIPDNWMGQIRAYKQPRADIFRRVSGKLPSRAVIVMLENMDNIDAMFYTDYTCYGYCSEADYHLLKKLNYRIIFWGATLPAYAKDDPNATLLQDFLK